MPLHCNCNHKDKIILDKGSVIKSQLQTFMTKDNNNPTSCTVEVYYH